MSESRMIKRHSRSIHWDLDGLTIAEAIEFLQNAEQNIKNEKVKKGATPVEVVKLSYDTGWGDSFELNIEGYGRESELEKAKRELLDKQHKDNQRERELKTLAALEKKYRK